MQILLKMVKPLCVFFVIAALILSVSGCTSQSFDTMVINSTRSFEGIGNTSRVYGNENTVKLASNESASVFLDKDSGGIALVSQYTGKKWTSLPYFDNSFASSFFAKVTDGEKIYILDSSAYLKNNQLSYKMTETGAVVNYTLSGENIKLVLPVEFSLSGAYLDVSCNIADCTIGDGLALLSVGILPFLGAVRYESSKTDYSVPEDYFLVPDGPGAIMYTALEDEHTSLTFSVYGKDFYEENIPAGVGAYGIVQDGSALCVTLTEGEENALIRAVRAGNDSKNINRIYSEFIITPVSGEKGKINAGSSYNGKIAVCYELLSRENADYTDIATSVRQTLIRTGLLSSEKIGNEYPFTVTLVAGADGKNSKNTATYQQIENLLGILKGKGINEVNAVLSGIFRGGISASSVNGTRLTGALGNKSDARALLSYARSQNFNVFAETNLLSAENSVYCEKGISGEYVTAEHTDFLDFSTENAVFTMKLLGEKGIRRGINNILSFVDSYGFSGVAAADAEITCRDASGNYSAYNNVLSDNFSAISAETKLMLSGVSMNVAKNADSFYNISFETAVSPTDFYAAVPFVPAVIHGSFIYSGIPSNLSGVSTIELLKAVEYGAVPHYLWCFDENSDKYYEYSLNEAVEFLLEAQKNLGDLSSRRITEHFKYEDGVYCTGYEGGVRVYVNYNNYSVIMGDISVMPYDYLRIG